MIIIYTDQNNKKYKLKKACYKNNFGEKVYNLTQLVDVTGSTEYKINNVVRLANMKSTELKVGNKIVNTYTHNQLKEIKNKLKSIKNFNASIKKIPYKSTVFHHIASRRLINLS